MVRKRTLFIAVTLPLFIVAIFFSTYIQTKNPWSFTINFVEPEPAIPTIPKDPVNSVLLSLWLSHQGHCDRTWTQALNINGGTFVLRCMFASIWYSMNCNRTFFIINDQPSSLLWTDFFLPLPSNCPLPPPVIYGPNSSFTDKQINAEKIMDLTTFNDIFSDVPHVWNDYWNPCLDRIPLPSSFQTFDIVNLIWQFNPKTKAKIEKILSKFPKWNTTRFHAFHIRRGDKVYGNAAEAEFKETEKYCQGLENALQTKDITDPVFVAADSWSTVEDVKMARPKWTVWGVESFKHMRQGNFTHSTLVKSSKEERNEWQLLLLSELTMLKWSHYFVGSGTSNIWQLVYVMRPKERPTVDV